LEELREWGQQNLITFLRIELDLALTFADAAKISVQMKNFEHFERSRDYVKQTLQAVRHFQARILDAKTRCEIQERAIEVKEAVAWMWPSGDSKA
jgi:hypothetical protein